MNRTTPAPEVPFAQLVREHYAPALRYAGRLLRDASEAEDCVQEAFAEAFLQLHTLRDPEAIAGWLRSIVRHRCLRRLRRRDLTLLPSTAELEGLEGAEHAAPDARNEQRAFARRLLELLPPRERELVTLFYLKECSQQEIASFLGLPLSTVNNRLHDARERMKKWEKHMDTNSPSAASSGAGAASRIGTLIKLDGPLAEARFDPDASFDLFDALAVVGADGRAVERMKVCQRGGGGRVLCLLTGNAAEPLQPGVSLLNTGSVGVGLTPLTRMLSVSASNLLLTIEALRGSPARAPSLLETGIKAVDLLCPVAERGVLVQAGSAGVGRIVLLDELVERISKHELSVLCLADHSEPDPYRGWDESVVRGSVGGMKFYWALSDQGTDPGLAALDAADAAIYLSPILAVQGAYPAIDPEHSRSRLLRPEIAGAEHCQLAARAREALLLAKRAAADPVLLELIACRAYAAARRRLGEHAPRLEGVDSLALARARKLQSFLTQPFETARAVTGWQGVHVSLADTLRGCRAILDGELDALPEGAFAYTGTLEQVRENARSNVSRSYYRPRSS
jgi:RNA polymerase sigma factor (sigma-70 family)